MLQQVGRSEEDELEEAIERSLEDCRRVLEQLRVPLQDRADLLQEAFLLFVERHRTIARPERWLPAVTRTLALRYWRARRWSVARLVDETVIELLHDARTCFAELSALRRDLGRALQGLRDRCRQLLILRYGLEYEASEVAVRLGCEASGLNTITRRCVAQFGERLVAAGLAPAARSGDS